MGYNGIILDYCMETYEILELYGRLYGIKYMGLHFDFIPTFDPSAP
jgi:hypothetical protein